TTCAYQPHGYFCLLTQPGNDSLDIHRMFRRLAKAGEERRTLTIRRRIHDSHQEALVCEQLAGSNEEISLAPLECAIRENLQPAVPAWNQDDSGFGVWWRQYKHPLGNAWSGRNIHDCLCG